MTLTVTQIKNAKPKEKAYKLADEHGLYLLVTPNGSKLWKLKYRFAGIEKKLSFGSFPEASRLFRVSGTLNLLLNGQKATLQEF